MDLVTARGRPVAPLALAAHPETPGACVGAALEAGIDTFFFYDRHAGAVLDALAPALPPRRDDVFLVTGTEERDVAGQRRDLDAMRTRLATDVLDLFLVLYVAPTVDRGDVDRLLDDLAALKESGAIRLAGASAHSRERAAELARDPRVDVLMHRYNMAHRGAEDVVLPAALDTDTPVIAFTCTRWGTLLAGHAEWDGPVPSAADCYRFALAQPAVRVALSAPHSVDELAENVAVLAAPPMSGDERARWRAYGDVVYGGTPGEFETRWP